MTTLALAGDTMLGRGVADHIAKAGPRSVLADRLREITTGADLFVLNLECCVSARGTRWQEPRKVFFFRAPPQAADALAWAGVDCVTLANNHALDYGFDALADTRAHLERAGIKAVGAGADLAQARQAVILRAGGLRVAITGVTDHPVGFAAGPQRPGVAYADLRRGIPPWLGAHVRALRKQADAVIVTPHWGPNMVAEPLRYVRHAAAALVEAGATVVAGHSAHVFHGIAGPVLYDLGDFIDDYAVDPALRNDCGLLFLVTLDAAGPVRLEAVPLSLGYCRTSLADRAAQAWIRQRFTAACAALGTKAEWDHGRLVVQWRT